MCLLPLLELCLDLAVRPRRLAGDAPAAVAAIADEVWVEKGDEIVATSGRRAVKARRTSEATLLRTELMMTCPTVLNAWNSSEQRQKNVIYRARGHGDSLFLGTLP